MANIQIKNRTAKNLNPKFIDFSATPLQGNLEANFFICAAFYPAVSAFYPLASAFVILVLMRNPFLIKI
jgi:hypothetical protein